MRTLRTLLLLLLVSGAATLPAEAAQRITEYRIPTPSSDPEDITTGPDGNLWFTEFLGNKIGRITTGGAVTLYPLPTRRSAPAGIASGPDQRVWFTEAGSNKIGAIRPSTTLPHPPV